MVDTEMIPGRDWNSFGTHLKYITTNKENHQCRIIQMWVNANTRDDSDGPKTLFEEIKISKKLFEKFKEMALEDKKSKD